MGKLKKNIGYQTIYQILITAMPLITSPYISRILGASQLGVYSYTLSIANYFVLFSMLGTTNYGTRAIAACGNNLKERTETFFSIYIFQVISSLVALGVYASYIIFICKENMIITILQGGYIIGSLLDVNWLFFGIEKFKITVTRNTIIKIGTIILILLIVRDQTDLWKYAAIMSLGTILSNVIIWYFLPKVIDIKCFKISLNIIEASIKHIKPNLLLFVPLLATSVYHIMDKTMLGLLSTYEQSGYYYNADKIINIPVGIITGIGTVMLPRMTVLLNEGKKEEFINLFNNSLEIIVMITTAMAFGMSAISKEFVPVFFGEGYMSCISLIILLSPVLVIKGFSLTARMQFLVPCHLEKIYTQAVIIGAIINLLINILLIPAYGAMGATIGTVIAELTACFWQYIRMKKYINFNKTLLHSFVYFLFGVVMVIGVRLISILYINSILKLLLQVMVGALIYLLLCWVFLKKNSKLLEILKRY